VAEDLKLLAFFVEEARQYRRQNKGLFSYKKELIHKKIYKDIFDKRPDRFIGEKESI